MELDSALHAFTQLGASWILWLLIGLSILCLAIILERGVCFATSRENVDALVKQLAHLANAKDWIGMRKAVSESSSFEARVAAAGLEEEPNLANERMLGAAETVRMDMEKNLAILGTVGSNAPFVGLLGTVIGIIGAFEELNQSQGRLTDGLMSEIGEALVATAVGLLVALPAVAGFNLFRRIVQRRMAGVEVMRQAVLGYVKILEEHK